MGCPESPTTDSVILLLPLCLGFFFVVYFFGFFFPIFPCTEVLEALMRPSKGIPTAEFRGFGPLTQYPGNPRPGGYRSLSSLWKASYPCPGATCLLPQAGSQALEKHRNVHHQASSLLGLPICSQASVPFMPLFLSFFLFFFLNQKSFSYKINFGQTSCSPS